MKKAFTLVEVIVATMVFTICFAAIITCYLMVNKQTEKESEYLRAEAICKDIALYGDEFGRNWDLAYYGVHDADYIYLDQSFSKQEGFDENSLYVVTYSYNSSNQLILSIKVVGENRYLVKDLNYGGARYETP